MANVNAAFNGSRDEVESKGDVPVPCVNGMNIETPVNVSVTDGVTIYEANLDDVSTGNITIDIVGQKQVTEGNFDSDKAVSSTDEPVEPIGCFKQFRLLLYRRRGLLFAMIGAFCFSLEDTLMDVLAKTVDVFQISCMVSALTVMISSVALIAGKIAPPKRKLEYLLLLITGVLLSLGLPTALLSLKYMDLGASISIIYTMPIFTGIFGWIILKEALRLIDLLFALVSFGGVILIAQPAFIFGEKVNEGNEDENLLLGTILALVSAVTFALMVVISRKETDMGLHLFVLMFCNGVVTCFINAMVCTFTDAWKMPSGVEWAEIIAFGVLDFIAQMFLIVAIMYEVAFLVSIATTSEVIFSFLWQIIIFQIIPDWQTGVGAVLIISSCVGIALKSSKADKNETEEKQLEEGGVDNVAALDTEEDEVSVMNGGKPCQEANHLQETNMSVNVPV